MRTLDPQIGRVLRAAAAAPSIANTQPWQATRARDTVTLRADPARQLQHTDPRGREMLISCGAFLLNARVAARQERLVATVRILPDPDDELLVAELTFEPGPAPTPYELDLATAIGRRTTSRLPFEDQPLFTDAVIALHAAAESEGATLRLVQHSDPAREVVIDLVRHAEALAAEDPAATAEEAAWTAVDPSRDDGIPRSLLGPVPTDAGAPVRRFAAAAGAARFERRSTMGVLVTPGDDAAAWITAGQALEHVLLVATTYLVHASFATTVLENPTTRHDLRRALRLQGAPQMVMRLGYQALPQHTPRRPVGP
ncbi:Acg family FMN-binding oxidoreductase [Promicromonospora thailandica]|uniref:Nitroreductase family protein n=1 Tax=Promicromonospora thailandica TaxID=765201 RepID=A0A9X2JYG0_9MICO|nr:hypothetical protein [Promicromonospora thailandica]MCP2267168.1 hypothetical protein [Promicromonospora thailandica]BFF17528.1 nitroreductase [Promicromonospora thailandica]